MQVETVYPFRSFYLFCKVHIKKILLICNIR